MVFHFLIELFKLLKIILLLIYIIMERGLMMLLHALLLGVLLYLLMVYGLKQSTRVAEDRSVLLGALVLAYMVLFGHGLPTKLNKNIM